ncbi:MAG: CRISPR-associated endonuclease Cas1 [Chloroflexota bacterium]
MAIVQHLIVDQFGAFIGKHSERILVTKGEQKIAQAPLIHLESILVAAQGVSLSSDAIRECTRRGIPIFFVSGSGSPYASLYSAGLTGTIATRRAQLRAYETTLGLDVVLAFGSGKLTNQANLLKYIAKYRKENQPDLYEELRRSAQEIEDFVFELAQYRSLPEFRDGTLTVEAVRDQLLGIEGRAAERYWSAVVQILPEKYAFSGRLRRGASDPVNAALNYGYGILYGQVERCLVLAGLDPYAGFLHTDRPGKPSMTLDFIEEFRAVVVDRTVFGMANRNISFEQDEDFRLTQTFRRQLAEAVLNRLESPVEYEGKRHPLRNVMQMQARHLAACLRGDRADYTPFVMSW